MSPITKTELKKALVEERAKQRAKAKQSSFLSRTRSIYGGQKKRAEEAGQTLDFSLDEFRAFFALGLEQPCPYSQVKLTVKNATADHCKPISQGGSFSLSNQVVCHQSANFQKGALTAESFTALLAFLRNTLSAKEAEDVLRRLTLGGKWSFGGK